MTSGSGASAAAATNAPARPGDGADARAPAGPGAPSPAEQLRIAEQAPIHVALVRGPDHVFEYLNPPMLALFGADVTGRTLHEAVGGQADGIAPLIERARASGAPVRREEHPVRVPGRDGGLQERFFTSTYAPLREPDGRADAVMIFGVDVTEQVAARRRAEAAAGRMARLQALTASLSRALTPAQVARAVCGDGLQALGACGAALARVAESGRLEILHEAGLGLGALEREGLLAPDELLPAAPNRPIWLGNLDALRAPAAAAAGRVRAWAALRLRAERGPVDVLALGFAAPRAFDEEERAFFATVAELCAQALERARLQEEAERRAAEAEEGRRTLEALLACVPEGITIARAPDLGRLLTSRFGDALLLGGREPGSGMSLEYWLARLEHFLADGTTPARPEDMPLWRAVRGGETVRAAELVLRRPDGVRLHLLCNAAPIRDDSGGIAGGVVAWQDITERRRAEEELRRGQATLRAILDATKESIWLFDAAGVIVTANQTALARMHRPAAELLGRRMDEVLRPELARARRARLDQVVESGRPAEFEDERDGMRFLHSFYPVFDDAGRVSHVASFSRDVTARRAGEEALRRSERALRTLAENVPDLIGRVDREGRHLYVNPVVERLTGRTIAEYLGRTNADLGFPPELCATWEAHFGAVFATGRPHDLEFAFDAPAGPVHLSHRAVPEFGEDGRVESVAFIARDVTDLKRAEEVLREADRRKNEFLAVLSHELRNPLAPIRNSLHVLERAAPGGEQARRALAVANRQVAHLARLVDDLLDVTRITRGKLRIERAPLDLVELVRRAVEDQRSVFEAAGVALDARVCDGPLPLAGDATRLSQVVGNLLQNAAKFTPAGGVARATLAREGADAVLRVSDTGAGLSADILARVFEPFAQADATLERSRGGLGLGLALVKAVVELHGGSASARSDGPGRGAEFVVRLPAGGGAQPAAGASAPDPGCRPLHVLLVEDNLDAAESMRDALELDGHAVEVAGSGPEGLERARALRPDVVVCDIGLPGMNGYEVARALRADPALRGTFLVALSGYALPEDVARAAEAGFDRHLAKPPGLAALARVLAEAAAHARPGVAA